MGYVSVFIVYLMPCVGLVVVATGVALGIDEWRLGRPTGSAASRSAVRVGAGLILLWLPAMWLLGLWSRLGSQ